MSIAATYVDANNFYISGDYRDQLAPGIGLRCNCGVDGYKYVFVNSVTYKDLNSLINTIVSESDSVTSNLSTIEISNIKPNSRDDGNIPSQSVLIQRGFKKKFNMNFVDHQNITIGAGFLHMQYEGREFIAALESDVAFAIPTLTADAWYFMYVNPPTDETLIISPSSSSFFLTTDIPVFNSTYLGWYHSKLTTARCIGFLCADYSGGSGGIRHFNHGRKWILFDPKVPSNVQMSTSITNVTIDAPLPSMLIEFYIGIAASASVSLYIKSEDSSTDPSGYILTANANGNGYNRDHFWLKIGTNKYIKAKINTGTVNFTFVPCRYGLPFGMCSS